MITIIVNYPRFRVYPKHLKKNPMVLKVLDKLKKYNVRKARVTLIPNNGLYDIVIHYYDIMEREPICRSPLKAVIPKTPLPQVEYEVEKCLEEITKLRYIEP